MAGLQVILSAFHRKESLYCPEASESLSNRIEGFIQHGVNALSATPSMWRALLQFPSFFDLSLIQITLGGEKSDSGLIRKLKESFPEARITQIYATSELGVIFSVKDGEEGFPIDYLDNFPHNDSQLRIHEGQLQVLRNGLWNPTGDRVEVKNNRVNFLGRTEEIVNVGGVKVDPSLVRNAILELEGILDAVVCGVRNPILGEILVAEVVLSTNSTIDELSIKEYLRFRVRRFEIPALIRIVNQISLNSNGKQRLSR